MRDRVGFPAFRNRARVAVAICLVAENLVSSDLGVGLTLPGKNCRRSEFVFNANVASFLCLLNWT